MFVLMAVATVLVSGAFVTSLALGFCDLSFILPLVLVIFIDAVSVYTYFIHPRVTVRKALALNTAVHFEFNDENYTVSAKSDKIDENSTSAYSTISKVTETKDFIYIFISKVQAFIVDKNGFTEGTPDGLIDFLVSKGVKYKR